MPVNQVAGLAEITYNFGLSNGSVAIEDASPSIWVLPTVAPISDDDWNTALLEMATAAYGGWKTNVGNGQWENSVQLSNVTARRTSTTDATLDKQVYLPTDDTWVGSETSGTLPWQTSLCISPYSYLRGSYIPNRRRRTGRFYLPPMSTNVLYAVDDGLLDPTLVATLLDELHPAWKAIQTADYSTSGLEPIFGINSRGPFKDPTVLPHFFPVVQLTADNKLDSQRRRTKRLESVIATVPYS